MKKRFFPLLSVVAIVLAGLACGLTPEDADTGLKIGLTAATVLAPTPTPFYSGPVEITISNYTLVDICEVDFYLAGTDIAAIAVHRWEPGEFHSLGAETIQGTKGTYDIYAFGCDGNILASQKDTAIYSDLSIVLAPE